MADSLLSMTASDPSRMALATSHASALVGNGLSSIDANLRGSDDILASSLALHDHHFLGHPDLLHRNLHAK